MSYHGDSSCIGQTPNLRKSVQLRFFFNELFLPLLYLDWINWIKNIYIYISSSISSHIKTKYEIFFFIHLSYWNLSVQLDSSCAVRQPEALSRFSALCPPQGTPTLRLPTKSTDRKRIAGGNFINFDFLGYSLLLKKIETICGLDIDDVVYNDKHVKVIVTKKMYMSHVHLI